MIQLQVSFFQPLVNNYYFNDKTYLINNDNNFGYLKGKVYVDPPQTTQDFKRNIQAEIEAIGQLLLQKVIENFDVRMMACQKSRGGHLNNIVFHS